MGRTGSAGQPPRGSRWVDRQWGRKWSTRHREEKPFRLGWGPPPPTHQPVGSLTPWDGEVAPGGWVPALGHSETDGPAVGEWAGHTGEAPGGPPPVPHASPRLGHDLPQHPHSIVVAHVLEVHVVHLWGEGFSLAGGVLGSRPPRGSPCPHLQQHVPWLDAAVRSHSPAFHDGADVDATVPPVVALAHNADAQEVVPLCWGVR